MTKRFSFLLLSLLLSVTLTNLKAQTVILDFEAAGSNSDFQYFGNGALDGAISSPISNPDASGINTTPMVLEFVKDGAALTWAGGFATPDPATAVDLTSDDQICIDVWMDHLGSVSLKLENSLTGDNWIITQNNTTTNAWETICFDATLPSIESPFTAAAGHVYPTVVIFFDFGSPGTGAAVTSYFDNVETSMGTGPMPADVTFSVNMNDYSMSYSNVFVNGTFNSWCGDCDTLFDPDGDGIYTGTVSMLTGAQQYKFTADSEWEQFNGFEECTADDGSGFAFNRDVLITGNTTMPTNCFGSCYDCGDAVSITFELGMAGVTVDMGGVYLAGGGVFDVPGGKYQMSDDDGDDVYTITVERQKGFASYYTFANGDCPDWSCKEDISGQPCADPANFNDRQFSAVSNDTTISTCFAQCTDNTTSCESVSQGLDVVEPGAYITVYPTVVEDMIFVRFEQAIENGTMIQLVDLAGKSHFEQQINAGETNLLIPASTLPQGMYLLNFSTNSITASQLVVKK